jgi:hypothetical protein
MARCWFVGVADGIAASGQGHGCDRVLAAWQPEAEHPYGMNPMLGEHLREALGGRQLGSGARPADDGARDRGLAQPAGVTATVREHVCNPSAVAQLFAMSLLIRPCTGAEFPDWRTRGLSPT